MGVRRFFSLKPNLGNPEAKLDDMLLNISVPVYNEERRLPRCIAQLDAFLQEQISHDYEIVIADNGSRDQTPDIARELSRKYSFVRVIQTAGIGRGRAL